MIPEKIGIKIWHLKAEARDELYIMIDKHFKKMPRYPDGSIKNKDSSYNDNDIDSWKVITIIFTLRKKKINPCDFCKSHEPKREESI